MDASDRERRSLVDAVGMAVGGMVGGGIFAVLGQAAVVIALLFTADLEQIVTFSSLVFLLVFSVVNGAALRHGVFPGWRRAVPGAGVLGCLAAAGTLVGDMARTEPGTLAVVGAVTALLVLLRPAFRHLHPAPAGAGEGEGGTDGP